MYISGEWNWYELSRVIDIKEVIAHPDLPWNREGLSYNSGITVDIIHRLEMSHACGDWHWDVISLYISMSERRKYPHHPWHMRVTRDMTRRSYTLLRCDRLGFSLDREITLHIIDSSTTYTNWYKISHSLSVREIHNHLHLPVLPDATGKWNIHFITQYIDLTRVDEWSMYIWNRENLSRNRSITCDMIRCIDRGYTHELRYMRHPKMLYKQSYLCDIEIISLS